MSADNYVKIRRFGKNDYRWGMWFASDYNSDFPDENFKHGPFKTPQKASEDAYNFCDGVIEYGVEFESNCLRKS